MKVVTYEVETPLGRVSRLGALLDQKNVVDLNLAYSSYFSHSSKTPRCYEMAFAVVPPNMIQFLEGGQESINAARRAINHVKEFLQKDGHVLAPKGEQILYPMDKIHLKAPVPKPPKIIHTGGNFVGHVDEFKDTGWGGYQDWSKKVPTGFLEAPCTVIGHGEPIIYP